MDTHIPKARRVSLCEFSQALQRAGYGLGAGLACRYDARRDETVWTVDGRPVGLTVDRIGATSACYLATTPVAHATAGAAPVGSREEPVEPPAPMAPVADHFTGGGNECGSDA